LSRFGEIIANRHEYAKEWKTRTGGKVLGYFCTYVPEEIIYAAGILPVRIIGSREPRTQTERHIANMYCPFCRDCLTQGLKGEYPYLDGIVMAHGCWHMRQAFASWSKHVQVEYSYYLSMPALIQSPLAKPFLVEELLRFKKSLEEWTGTQISDNTITHAIEGYNLNRRLLKQIYDLRKDANPPLSGAEALEMTLSSQLMDKGEHSRLLSEAMVRLQQWNESAGASVRLMLIGSENDDVDYLRAIESSGCIIVTDDICTGSRYFWNECEPGADVLDAIAIRYIERPPCPQKDLPEHRRLPHILSMAKDFKVEGVVITLQKFCHNHQTDLPVLKSLFQKEGIPVLALEYAFAAPVEWLQLRIAAFVEMIQSDLFGVPV
jgi:benzoyl-CoA reductase subunit C